METIKLTIDGSPAEVEKDKTVLQAAREIGIEIPTLCAHEALSDYGACRLCVVEIEGVRGYPTSCTTPVRDGMVVRTQSDELTKLRNSVIELTLSGHPNACLVCGDREECEMYRPRPRKSAKSTRCGVCSNRSGCLLRDLAIEARSQALDLPTLYRHDKVESDDPFMSRDHNLCILCGRCWRICEKIHGRPAISINNRGRWAKVGVAFDKSWVESPCTFCGACIDICPTGTLTDRYARWYGEANAGAHTVCTICSAGCRLTPTVSKGRLVGARMISFDRDARLCALGRFAHPQILNHPKRLLRPTIREDGELVPADWERAVAAIAEKLEGFKDGGFVAVVDPTITREAAHLYEKFATQVMNGRMVRASLESEFCEIGASPVRAAIVCGNHVAPRLLEELEYLVVVDALPSPAADRADAVLPAAVLTEATGTFRNSDDEVRAVSAAVNPPGFAMPEWKIVCDLAKAMGAGGFDYSGVMEVSAEIVDDEAPPAPAGSPRDAVKDLPVRFRGHLLADLVPALAALGLPNTPEAERSPAAGDGGGFRIVSTTEPVPDFHLITVEAPVVARNAKAGQFFILMVDETSERVPFTLADWDADAGTITFVVEEVGRSSGEIAAMRAGDTMAHVTGPLGMPLPFGSGGTIVLGGGCYGVAAIYPLARAAKAAGNRVIGVIEAASGFLVYMEEKLGDVCDELIVATKDGSRGRKGGVQDVFVDLARREPAIDRFVAIGCTFMMRMVSRATASLGIPLQVALNPIMVDGTGMCGACRVSVSNQTKFACVDGPFFDGHAVDWDELDSRRGAYTRLEIEAIPQAARRSPRAVTDGSGHVCACKD